MEREKSTMKLMVRAMSWDSFPVIAIIGILATSKAGNMTAEQLHPLKAVIKPIHLKKRVTFLSCNFFFLKFARCFLQPLALETSLS